MNIKRISSIYNRIIKYLSKHKAIALFFSHGGLHLVVLCILIISAFLLYIKVEGYNKQTFRQMNIHISDTLRNHKVTDIYLYKNMEPRENSMSKTTYFGDFFLSLNYERIGNKNVKHRLPYDSVKNDSTNIVSKVIIAGDRYGKEIRNNPPKEQIAYRHHKNNKIIAVEHVIQKTNKEVEHYYTSVQEHYSYHYLISSTGQNVLKNWDDDNPYYCFWIGINIDNPIDLCEKANIEILFNPISNPLKGQPVIPDKVIPVPSEITTRGIVYKGKENVESVLKQGGIFVSGVDPAKKAKADKAQLLYTVLMGTIIAFALDVFVQLIIKWKKLGM